MYPFDVCMMYDMYLLFMSKRMSSWVILLLYCSALSFVAFYMSFNGGDLEHSQATPRESFPKRSSATTSWENYLWWHYITVKTTQGRSRDVQIRSTIF
jgi:hypothetical protein